MAIIAEVSDPLTIQDRCDKCNAQAKVRALFESGELFFCGHHARENQYKLFMKSIKIHDPEGVFDGDE